MRSYSTRASLRTWARFPESLCTRCRPAALPLHGMSRLGMGSCTFRVWSRLCVCVSHLLAPWYWVFRTCQPKGSGSPVFSGEANWDVIYLGEEVVTGFLGELPCGSPTWRTRHCSRGLCLTSSPLNCLRGPEPAKQIRKMVANCKMAAKAGRAIQNGGRAPGHSPPPPLSPPDRREAPRRCRVWHQPLARGRAQCHPELHGVLRPALRMPGRRLFRGGTRWLPLCSPRPPPPPGPTGTEQALRKGCVCVCVWGWGWRGTRH